MSFDTENLYNLLPAIFRIRDAEVETDPERAEPLRALLGVIADQAVILESDLDRLYDDQFIETCAAWVVPYIGNLIGLRGVQGPGQPGFTPRAEVAHTIGYRRRKGTAAMLELLAHDVTGWPARAVEFFQLLATTQYMNHIRLENRSFVSVRDANRLECLGSAFEHLPPDADLPHTADVRRIASGRGRYNIPNVGIFLWRLRDYALTRSPAVSAAAGDQQRFLFNPLGLDSPLFNLPETEDEMTSLATPLNVPMPISRRVLDANLGSYYGESSSLFIEKRGPNRTDDMEPIAVTDIHVCDLSDVKDNMGVVIGWAHTPPIAGVAVDPTLGRVAFADPQTKQVFVSFHYGFSANLGGGEYNRVNSFNAQLTPVVKVANVHVEPGTNPMPAETIDAAIAALPDEGGVVEITDSGRYAAPATIDATIPPGSAATARRIEVRAGDKHRPAVILGAEMHITGGDTDEVSLNGLLLSGAVVRVQGDLARLVLKHCTLVPGTGASLIVESKNTIVEIDRCILGPIRVNKDAHVQVIDSILDATDESAGVYANVAGAGPGGALRIENSTVIGTVQTVVLELASNTIFVSPVTAVRRQEGCVRFCYVAPGSQTPPRFRCVPESDADAARLRPQFTSSRYGDPGYVQLSAHCADEIRRGADDESEMGAFHHLLQPQREAYLRARLEEYLRFGLEAGLIFAS